MFDKLFKIVSFTSIWMENQLLSG